ncbi:3-phosphoshikimate 1-carboxyvinyltransferase [Candidatus Neomarinimicrobiota bacterium]
MSLHGSLLLPGDKSISHRALMLAAIAADKSTIKNIGTGADVEATRNCLEQCGIKFNWENKKLLISGSLGIPDKPLNCQNSGTTARLLIGFLAGQKIQGKLIGDASLSKRPMKRVIDPLEKMGALIRRESESLPLEIVSSELRGINYVPPIASAQVKSCVLLAGLGAKGKTVVSEIHPTRDHTEIILKELGANINVVDGKITLDSSKSVISGFDIVVPADPSTAAFYAAAAIAIPGSKIIIKNCLLNPRRIAFFKFLKKSGANISIQNQSSHFGEVIGDISVKSGEFKALTISPDDVPSCIDELPILAILATKAYGVTTVTGAEELRVKESDRIKAICFNLKRMGADIEELPGGFQIQGPKKLSNALIHTFNDHRIAMAFMIAGLISNVPIELDDSDCINVSFPGFFKVLKQISK